MILILSNPFFQVSMDKVIDWLIYKKKDFIRINGLNDSEIKRIYSNLCEDIIELNNNRSIDLKKITAVWFYRWGQISNESELIINNSIFGAHEAILKNLNGSRQILSSYFFYKTKKAKWLGNIEASSINKLAALEVAKGIGLAIPETIIATSKTDILNFINKHDGVITKPIWEIAQLEYTNKIYTSFTSVVSKSNLKVKPETIFPTLLQKKIKKKFEIRSFFINNRFYSMAIFSQANKQTSVDFRVYDDLNPNRTVPYKLPQTIEKKLKNLMKAFSLNTGSLDLIVDSKGKYIFLEINPVGQYGMTSKPCNYYLEKKIAERL